MENDRPASRTPLSLSHPQTLAVSLRDKLDEIDKRVAGEVYNGLYEGLLKIQISMWEKGKAICEWLQSKGKGNYGRK